jgi:hypothetical protein
MPGLSSVHAIPEQHAGSAETLSVDNSHGAAMNGPRVVPLDEDARWQAWKAHGAESDRRSSIAMKWLFAIVFSIVVGWLAVQAL